MCGGPRPTWTRHLVGGKREGCVGQVCTSVTEFDSVRRRAMAVSGKNHHYPATIMRRHFNATAARCGWGETAEDVIGERLAKVNDVIERDSKKLPDGFPESAATAIFEGMRNQAKRLQEQPAA